MAKTVTEVADCLHTFSVEISVQDFVSSRLQTM